MQVCVARAALRSRELRGGLVRVAVLHAACERRVCSGCVSPVVYVTHALAVIAGIMAMLILSSAHEYLTTSWTCEDAWEEFETASKSSAAGKALSAEAMDLLARILVPEEERISIHQVLEHPWFQDKVINALRTSDVWDRVHDLLIPDMHGMESVGYDTVVGEPFPY